MCGTCTGRHRTSSCSPGSQPRCVSCRMEGHMSWSRYCPTFIWKCDEMNGRLTENTMPYFPSNEPWTHVMKPPKPAYHPLLLPTHHSGHPGHQPSASRGPYRQSTLQFPRAHQRPYMDTHPPSPPTNALGHLTSAPPPATNMEGAGKGREWLRSKSWGDADDMNENEGLPDISFI